MYKRKIEENLDCGIIVASKVFGGKWKCCILDTINRGITRPADIRSYIPEASKRVLEIQLAELLSHGIVEKSIEVMYPKETHYRLTTVGKSILPILTAMDQWGLTHSDFIKDKQQKLEAAS